MQCTWIFFFFLSKDLKVKKKCNKLPILCCHPPFWRSCWFCRQTALRFFSPTSLCKIKVRGAHSLLSAPWGSSSVKNWMWDLRSLVFAVAAAFQRWDVYFPQGGSFSPHRQMSLWPGCHVPTSCHHFCTSNCCRLCITQERNIWRFCPEWAWSNLLRTSADHPRWAWGLLRSLEEVSLPSSMTSFNKR